VEIGDNLLPVGVSVGTELSKFSKVPTCTEREAKDAVAELDAV